MTLDEIETLIEEFEDTVAELQGALDDQFEFDSLEPIKVRKNEAYKKLFEAIIEYGRESAAEAFIMGEQAPLKNENKSFKQVLDDNYSGII